MKVLDVMICSCPNLRIAETIRRGPIGPFPWSYDVYDLELDPGVPGGPTTWMRERLQKYKTSDRYFLISSIGVSR